jgi:winged helix domain-containing protein/ATPase family protein associated with various cellular activities (AAA)
MQPFFTSLQHVLAELERIDLLIRLQVWRSRQLHQTDSEFQGLYISEEEVNALLREPAGMPRWAAATPSPSHAEVTAALERLSAVIAARKEESARQGLTLRLDGLARSFALSPLEVDVLLIALAPEIDPRYEKLFAYLQDDVTRKRPSVDLVLNLLCPDFEAKLAARSRFGAAAPLVRHRLLHLFEDPSRPHSPLLAWYVKAEERAVSFLFGSDEPDARLLPFARVVQPAAALEDLLLPAAARQGLLALGRSWRAGGPAAVLYLQGPYGAGRETAAEALCRELGLGVLVVDLERLLAVEDDLFETLVAMAHREALLRGAALCWRRFDLLLADDKAARRMRLVRSLEERRGLSFLTGETAWEPADALRGAAYLRVELPRPGQRERLELWQRTLGEPSAGLDLAAVAARFRLTPGQIRDAAATARNLARGRVLEAAAAPMPNQAELQAACRLHSNPKLSALAQKITPKYGWSDIVLPADRLEVLREICNAVRYRARVYEDWGFGGKLSLGKGLNVLFAGPPGTGKTMGAEVVAGELGLDLYKIDLSTVVSKYIGETEKNLARLFAEGETSNALLFFDEADALFGKRSEVRDSHDRYANLEISYLLQRMDEYEGVVILATNLRKNMDDAFARRMHFTLEFPFPGESDRQRIWSGLWPAATPRSEEIDLDLLARRYEIAGGNIRNIVLAAAFLAAADGGTVTMAHLLRATQREYQKMGKVTREGEFGSADRPV